MARPAMVQTWDMVGRRSQLNGVPFTYQADGSMTGAGGSTFGYASSGLLIWRTNASRGYVVNQRDGTGRITQATTTVGGSTALAETLLWRDDGRLTNYVAARGDFTDTRNYSYSPLAQRLTQESFNVSASQTLTNVYTTDNGATGGLGILTAKAESGAASATWTAPSTGGLDGLSRLAESQNTLINRPAYGQAVGAGFVVATLDGDPVAVQFDGCASNGLWRANLDMASGSHTLAVTALDPSGYFAGSSNSSFTVASGAVDTVTNTYDGNGNITQRVWINNLGKTNRIETLTWDAFDRMIQETDRDTNNSGWNFVCVYDGLGRRVRAIETFVTNGVAITSPASSVSTVDSWYDPQVEFLEVAVNVNSNVTVKTYGPDNSGVYGGMQGVGGLEAIYGTGYVQSLGSVQDYFGNVIGTITNGGVLWNPARFSSYGPVPGYQPLSLSLNTTVAQTVGWHGLHIDPDGDYHIGARRYGPTEGRWLSADPFGHSASMDLYSYCGGDPVNFGDPDGRCINQAIDFVGNTISGFANVIDPVPVQLRPTVPDPNTMSGYYGRQFGSDLGLAWSFYQIVEGLDTASTGGALAGAGGSVEFVSLGSASPVALPAAAVGGGLVVGGAVVTTGGLIGVNNFWFNQTGKPPNGSGGGKSSSVVFIK